MDISTLTNFLAKHPVKHLRLQWLDYTATPRVRILPIDRALSLFAVNKSIGITKAVLGMLQDDVLIPSFSPIGEYKLIPALDSLRLGSRHGYATVQCEFWEHSGAAAAICPRSVLRNAVQRGHDLGISFLVGFELEVVFLRPSLDPISSKTTYLRLKNSGAHAWSAISAMHDPDVLLMIEEIISALQQSEIELQQWHPESAPGQYEFVTGPLAPLAAVDTLIATRDIVFSIAAVHGLKATLVPKPYPMACGTGAHVHISLSPEDRQDAFYAGVLADLRRIAAFTYSGKESYERATDSDWSGGRYIGYGTQNRETPLRKVEGSHWEIKCMDGLANPYLAIAHMLDSGLNGVRQNVKMTHKDCAADPALLTDQERKNLGFMKMMPAGVEEALSELSIARPSEDAHFARWRDVYNVYRDIKTAEQEALAKLSDDERRTFMIEHY